MFKPTNAELTNALKEKFNIPIHYGFNEDIDTTEFIVYQNISIDVTDKCKWVQNVNVYYVSLEKEDLLEKEIYDVLRQDLKMGVQGISYDRVDLSNKATAADVVCFYCTRTARFF